MLIMNEYENQLYHGLTVYINVDSLTYIPLAELLRRKETYCVPMTTPRCTRCYLLIVDINVVRSP